MRFSAFSEAAPGISSQEVLDVQGKLLQLGYELAVTGSYDGATSRAVLDFRSKQSLPLVDKIDPPFVIALEMQGRAGYHIDASGNLVPPSNTGMIIGGVVVGGLLLWWATR